MDVSKAQLKRYAAALAMWHGRFNTAEIATQLKLPESLVARWIANYRDLMRQSPAVANG
jgi:hypothetical protein